MANIYLRHLCKTLQSISDLNMTVLTGQCILDTLSAYVLAKNIRRSLNGKCTKHT